MPTPNVIKWSTATQSGVIRKGNFHLGVSDVDYGPTETTGFYSGITASDGGYTIYRNKTTSGPAIYVAQNDGQLLNLFSNVASLTVKNLALPLSANWPAKRSDVVEITDGSIEPPNAGARVWRSTINTTTYPNTLHRMWNFGNQNGMIGNLGNGFYRYYLWVRGASTNSATASFQIDISDAAPPAAVNNVIIGTSSTWQLLSAIDSVPSAYNTDKFIDFSPFGVNGDIFYISSIHVVSINAATASELISMEFLPFPGYIDYSATKLLSFTAASQCLFYANQNPEYLIANKTYEPIVTQNLQVHYDANWGMSYPQVGTTWYDVGSSANRATLINGASFSTNGFVFDGANDYIQLSSTVSLAADADWTIQAWVSSFSTQGQSAYLRFLGNGTSGTNNHFFFEWNNRIFSKNSDGNSFVFFTGFTPALPLNDTPFLLNIINRSGYLEVWSNAVKTTATASFAGALQFREVMRERGSTSPGGRLFSFSHYDKALTDVEILQNFNAQKSLYGL